MFGSVRYLTDSNKGLPNYAADVAYALGGPRMILPGLLIAYAFGILLALFLAASTAVIAELVGPNFMHKHHHIYRPMLLKALAAFLAYGTALQVCHAQVLIGLSNLSSRAATDGRPYGAMDHQELGVGLQERRLAY